jgi:acyl-CoA synthetase (NDP forming)
LLRQVLSASPEGGPLEGAQLRQLLGHYGVVLLEMIPAATVEEAVAAGEQLGWDVVLKATAQHLRQRPDHAEVWRHIDTPDEMRDAWTTLVHTLPNPAEAGFVVQPMATPGVPVDVRAWEDPLVGPLVSFGLAGVMTELLGDRSYRIPPLTDVDASDMVRELRSAPLLFGHRGAAAADVEAIENLLHRVARLTDDLPEVSSLELNPVLVAPRGLAVVNAAALVAPAPLRSDWYTRRLG